MPGLVALCDRVETVTHELQGKAHHDVRPLRLRTPPSTATSLSEAEGVRNWPRSP